MRRFKLIRGLPLKKLLEQIYFHARNGEASRRALAFYLKDLADRKDGDEVGHARATHFADCKLHMPAREVRELIRIAGKPEELTAPQWRELEGRVEWHQNRRSFVFRSEGWVPERDPRGSFFDGEALSDNGLQRRTVHKR